MRGSRCARFEVHTVDGREDMYNTLLLICYKGGALWETYNIIPQYTFNTAFEIDYNSLGWGKYNI